MQSKALTPDQYICELPDDRKLAVQKLRQTLLDNLPKGFQEVMSYGMLGYVVPHTIYPNGYHCDPKLPLGFMAIASQKNFIALYQMTLSGDEKTTQWFIQEYHNQCATKLDMGKCCIRFKKINDIPYDLIAALAQKMSVEQWILKYENTLNKK